MYFFFFNLEKFTAETILSGKFNFLSAAEAKKNQILSSIFLTIFFKMSLSNVNSSQKSQFSQKPELIDLSQDEFVDLTQISDNSGVTYVSETQMVVINDTLSYKSDSSSKSEKPGMYNLNFFLSIN